METRRYRSLRIYLLRKMLFRYDFRIFIFLFFVVISSLLWLFNALSKDYTTYVDVPIKFVDLPRSRTFMDDVPEKLKLKMQGKGIWLLKYNLTAKKEVSISVASLRQSHAISENAQRFSISTLNTKEYFIPSLKSNIQILSVLPDSIHFKYDKISSKTVVVKPRMDITADKNFAIKIGSIKSHPKNVIIVGSEQYLSTIDSIETHYTDLTLRADTHLLLGVHTFKNKKIQMSPERVEIEIPVLKYTESSVRIKVNAKNLPPNTHLITFPYYITILFQVFLQDFDKVKPEDFMAEVDYSQIVTNLETNQNRLRVKLVKQPNYILPNSINYFPKRIDFILENDKSKNSL